MDNIDQINILDTNMKGTYRLTCCYKYIVTRSEKQYNKELDVYKEMCEKKKRKKQKFEKRIINMIIRKN